MAPTDLSLTAQAYDRIRGDILASRLPPGRKLKISELCATLGFGLGAVREALSRLTSEGLVESERNKGFRVTAITRAELEDLTRVRIMIEGECLRGAIKAGDLAWETGIVSARFELSRTPMRQEGRLGDGWSAAHARFHDALVAACPSPWLLRIRALLYAQSERYRSASVPLDRHARDVEAEHRAIAEAAIARDAGAACAAMRAHVEGTTAILLAAGLAEAEAAGG